MKTKLLRKLRRKSKKKYRVVTDGHRYYLQVWRNFDYDKSKFMFLEYSLITNSPIPHSKQEAETQCFKLRASYIKTILPERKYKIVY